MVKRRRRRRPQFRAPQLYIEVILAWADAHYARTGRWPNVKSGRVRIPGLAWDEKWHNIDTCLRQGLRGLPRDSGWSLARLLAQYRGVRNVHDLPPLTVEQILEWVDAFFARTGRWPDKHAGPIPEAPGETWRSVDTALLQGYRGLSPGLTLPRLLAANRGVRNISALPPLTIKQILAWADAYYRQHGAWPGQDSGPVAEAPDESWGSLNAALREGYRGLPGGSSLALLLRDKREVRHIHSLPRLSISAILKWCDAWHARTGKWPLRNDGPIHGTRGETWRGIDRSLRVGSRGLPGNSSLPRLLDEKRGVGSRTGPLTPALILSWADAYFARTGGWPNVNSGHIPETRDDTWKRIDHALRQGYRGLPKKPPLSLARLLNKFRGVRNSEYPPPVTESQIVRWAKAQQRQTGKRPSSGSGPVLGVPGETWNALDLALQKGRRGLPGGSSLSQLLEEHGIQRDNAAQQRSSTRNRAAV